MLVYLWSTLPYSSWVSLISRSISAATLTSWECWLALWTPTGHRLFLPFNFCLFHKRTVNCLRRPRSGLRTVGTVSKSEQFIVYTVHKNERFPVPTVAQHHASSQQFWSPFALANNCNITLSLLVQSNNFILYSVVLPASNIALVMTYGKLINKLNIW